MDRFAFSLEAVDSPTTAVDACTSTSTVRVLYEQQVRVP